MQSACDLTRIDSNTHMMQTIILGASAKVFQLAWNNSAFELYYSLAGYIYAANTT